MLAKQTTAAEMALSIGVDPEAFRAALRKAKSRWHNRKNDWEVKVDSAQYSDMRTVLVTLLKHRTIL